MTILGLYNYWVFVALMMAGLFVVIARGNLIKKLVGLGVFQASTFLLFISMSKAAGGTAPILDPQAGPDVVYSNPLPHVLILTAIVVAVSTTAVALALVVRIHEAYGTIEEDEILRAERSS